MLKRLAAALLVALLPACSSAETVVITNDGGGYIDAYNQRAALYRNAGTKVVIDGECMSACARYMSLPKVCTTPKGRFWLHGGTDDNGNLHPQSSREDSLLNETPKAVALQDRYGVYRYGTVKKRPKALVVPLEPGVERVYEAVKTRRGTVWQVWLRVRADKLVPRCS